KEFRLPPVAIHLLKVLPVGAGLGGGSADGAFTLKTLNDLLGLGLSLDRLKAYAAWLGSDCAFFTEGKPIVGTGRGGLLEDINLSLKGKFVIIVKPEVSIPTSEAFAAVSPEPVVQDVKSFLEQRPISEWKEVVKNDFEKTLFE